jgi:HK97 family phage portal protein
VGWWSRLAHELRSLVLGPYPARDPALVGLFGSGPSVTGEPVGVERAVSLSAVWACVSLIAGTIASMPLVLYRRLPNGERERAVEHPLFDVLKLRPNPTQSVVAFWESLTTSLLLRGNGFAAMTRDDDGRVRALWPINPDRVMVEVQRNGRLRYKVSAGASTETVRAEDMLHVVGPLSDDGYTGRSVITTFRDTLGLGLALERYGGEFFANAATPAGTLTTPARLSPVARQNITDALQEKHATPGRRHRTLILEEGLKFEPLSISPEDAEMVESRRFTVEEIARIFGVPPHMIGGDVRGSLTYSNAETEALRLLKHTIGPWLARIEAAVNFACVPALERRVLYAEWLTDSLLSTTTGDRYAAYEVGLRAGFLTVNEVRAKENLPALDALPSLG